MAKRNLAERRAAKVKRRERKGGLALLEGGLPCPKGHGDMQRCGHGPEWRPKKDVTFDMDRWEAVDGR